ncbi:MAG: site-specific integrase [Dehalococcoidia bacterium]|nr:site-specific integrase [Dehalococcoidia bacterium]
MPRRGNNEGTIRQRPDGKWEAAVQFNGRRHWLRAASQAEARRGLAELRRKHATGELVPPSRQTVAEHLGTWLEVAGADLRPRTRVDYEWVTRTFLIPAFGHVRLQRLTPAMVARQFAEWNTAGTHSPKTRLNVFRTFSRALTVARYWGLIGTNPLDAVEAPKASRSAPSIWSRDEAETFLALLQPGAWDSTLFLILAGTGCRIGEALAARWEDYDRDTSTLAIHRNVTTIHGAYVEGDPKTQAGKRTIVLPGFVIDGLKAWRPAQLAERLAAGEPWTNTGRIITLPDGASPPHHTAYNRFKGTCGAAGVPKTRMHDLRHLHASFLLSAGLPLPAVSARLGHANSAVTASIYSHAMAGVDSAAAVAIEGLGAKRQGAVG